MANSDYNEQDFNYQFDGERRVDGDKEKAPRQKRANYARANRPAVHNGIHRRRNKRFSW